MIRIPSENALGWYEANLPSTERKQRGHFSTPPRLVEYILDACGYTPTADLSRIRVLDPACGSGNFLAGAAHRLVTSLLQVRTDTLSGGQVISRPPSVGTATLSGHPLRGRGNEVMTGNEVIARPRPSYGSEINTAQPTQTLNQRKILQHVQRNLWGFDPDPIACFLAEMQLRETVQRASGGQFPHKMHFHIHQADGLALPWEMCEGVDLFLANPPYLATKNSDLTGYRLSHAGGQIDSYLLFLEMALRIVRPGGWLAIVLPDPVLARANASRERTRLLETVTIHHLWHLANVFNAQVGAVVLVAQKCSPTSTHTITWVREKWSRSGNALNMRGNNRGQYLSNGEDGRRPLSMPDVEDGRRPSSTSNGEDGRPPLSTSNGEDGRPPLSTSNGEDGRSPSSTSNGEDGRPQGAPPIHPTSPVPTIYEQNGYHGIVGTGVGWTWGGAPCGRPSSDCASLYMNGIDTCGHPSSDCASLYMNGIDTCGRPSSDCASLYMNGIDTCGRPSSDCASPYINGLALCEHPSSPIRATRASVPQSLFLQQPRAEFRYLLSSEHGIAVERLRAVWDASSEVKQNFAPLSTFLSIRRGEELGRENSQLVQTPASLSELNGENSSWLPVLRGGVDIRPYATPVAQWRIARESVAKPLVRYLAPKLLVVKSTNRLQATLDMDGHVALQTLYLLHPLADDASGDELYFFLALLNSRLLQKYVYMLYTAYKWVQPQIEQHVLAQLPVPVIASDYKSEIIERARHMVLACDKASPVVEWNQSMQCLYAGQERAICALYASALPGLFPKEM